MQISLKVSSSSSDRVCGLRTYKYHRVSKVKGECSDSIEAKWAIAASSLLVNSGIEAAITPHSCSDAFGGWEATSSFAVETVDMVA